MLVLFILGTVASFTGNKTVCRHATIPVFLWFFVFCVRVAVCFCAPERGCVRLLPFFFLLAFSFLSFFLSVCRMLTRWLDANQSRPGVVRAIHHERVKNFSLLIWSPVLLRSARSSSCLSGIRLRVGCLTNLPEHHGNYTTRIAPRRIERRFVNVRSAVSTDSKGSTKERPDPPTVDASSATIFETRQYRVMRTRQKMPPNDCCAPATPGVRRKLPQAGPSQNGPHSPFWVVRSCGKSHLRHPSFQHEGSIKPSLARQRPFGHNESPKCIS